MARRRYLGPPPQGGFRPPGLQGPLTGRPRPRTTPPGLQGPLLARGPAGPGAVRVQAPTPLPTVPGATQPVAAPVNPQVAAYDQQTAAQQARIQAAYEQLARDLQGDQTRSGEGYATLARAAAAAYGSSPTDPTGPEAVRTLPGALSDVARREEVQRATADRTRWDNLTIAARGAGVSGAETYGAQAVQGRTKLLQDIAAAQAEADKAAADQAFQERKAAEDARHNKATEASTLYGRQLDAILAARGLDAKTASALQQTALGQARLDQTDRYQAGQLDLGQQRVNQAGQPKPPKAFSSSELVSKGFRGGWAARQPGSVQATDTGRWYAPPAGKGKVAVKVDAKGFTTALPKLLSKTTQDPATGKKLTAGIPGAWRTAVTQGVRNYGMDPATVVNQVLNATNDNVEITDVYDALRQAGVGTAAARQAVSRIVGVTADDLRHLDAITVR